MGDELNYFIFVKWKNGKMVVNGRFRKLVFDTLPCRRLGRGLSVWKRPWLSQSAMATPPSLAVEAAQFIDSSPTPFHLCAEASALLRDAGFVELAETAAWRPLLKPGGHYFYVRGGTLVAFTVGAGFVAGNSFNIVAAHTDSPVLLKLKPCSKRSAHGYLQVSVRRWRLMVEACG